MKNCWQRTPGTVTNLLDDLKKSRRRKVACLTMLHKTIHGESALEIPSYIKRCNCQLRSYHKDKFSELKPNTETYKKSFYCRTIKEWNSLPSNSIDIVKTPLFSKHVVHNNSRFARCRHLTTRIPFVFFFLI